MRLSDSHLRGKIQTLRLYSFSKKKSKSSLRLFNVMSFFSKQRPLSLLEGISETLVSLGLERKNASLKNIYLAKKQIEKFFTTFQSDVFLSKCRALSLLEGIWETLVSLPLEGIDTIFKNIFLAKKQIEKFFTTFQSDVFFSKCRALSLLEGIWETLVSLPLAGIDTNFIPT